MATLGEWQGDSSAENTANRGLIDTPCQIKNQSNDENAEEQIRRNCVRRFAFKSTVQVQCPSIRLGEMDWRGKSAHGHDWAGGFSQQIGGHSPLQMG
jgi:hypothetical protein